MNEDVHPTIFSSGRYESLDGSSRGISPYINESRRVYRRLHLIHLVKAWRVGLLTVAH